MSQKEKLTILYVEDNPYNQLVMKRLCRPEDYRLTVVNTADAALKLHDEGQRYDLYFIDIQLAGALNGDKLILELRRRYGPSLDIHIITAYALKGDRERYMATTSANGYFSKPMVITEIMALLNAKQRQLTTQEMDRLTNSDQKETE
jgi:CheY-like chemotaxis protein